MSFIRSISGLRATLGDDLHPDIVVRYVSAFARFIGGGEVVVGRDGRPSGGWIEDLVVGTLRASGVSVRRIGVAPTPTVQLATEHSGASGGISITASHNPVEWNGLKFLNAQGIFLDAAECEGFFAIVDSDERAWAGPLAAGALIEASGLLGEHVDRTLALGFVDLEGLRARNFVVVVDAVNASGSDIVPLLLERCGCRVVPLYCDGSGLFPHTPEPLPQNLTELARAVVSEGADFGVAVDPDADRLVLIDERGESIGEEYTITLAADFILARERERDPNAALCVAVNLSTTRAVDDVAVRYGAEVLRTPVGEINVARRMRETGAVIGGEGSGGVILSSLHYGRDSLAGIIITLSAMLRHGGKLSELRDDLPSYHIVKKKMQLPEGTVVSDLLAVIASNVKDDVQVRTDDGVRFDFDRSWVHLRGSNTEPIVRVIAEAPTEAEAEELVEEYGGKLLITNY
jgi:phosphomannomutase